MKLEDALPNDEEGDALESDENDEMALNEGDALGEDVEDADEGEPPVPPRPEPLADGSCEAPFQLEFGALQWQYRRQQPSPWFLRWLWG